MASFPHKRSFSEADVHELKKQCCSSQNPYFTTPMDISAAVGYGNKTDIFNIHRPKRRMIGNVKKPKRKWSLPIIRKVFCATECKAEEHKASSCSQSIPRGRKKSKVDGYSLHSKSEGKCCDLRDSKGFMLFPHITLDLQHGKELKTENIQSDVIDKFPEKSVLLQAHDGNDETQNELTLSSVTSQTESLQKVCKCTGDSSVIVSDEAVLIWRGREVDNKSEPTITCVTGSFSNQPPLDHARRVASKSSLQSHYISSLDKSAGETPTNEVSPYYATTQEKQAFNKIKEWRHTFSIQLDHILQQRQGLSQLPAKNTKNKLDMRVSTSHYHEYVEEANANQKPTSHLPARKSLPEMQALAHNMQQRVISELRAFSQMSVNSKEGIQNSNKGKIILQEIKRQRGQIKCVHDDDDFKDEIESLEKQESHRIFHLWTKSDTNKDIQSFQKHTVFKRNREVDMKTDNKQNLSSTAVSCTTHSQASESQVKEVLYSLRKTIDTIFTSTIQRISDLMVITGSSESYSEFNSQHCDQLLRKMEVAKEERDSLCLENMNLKREISDLKRQLAKTLDEMAGEISTGRHDSLKSTDSLVSQKGGDYVRIEEIHRVVSHFKEFAGGYGPNVEGTLSADSYELSSEIDDSDMQDLWIRQAIAETVVLQDDQLSFFSQ